MVTIVADCQRLPDAAPEDPRIAHFGALARFNYTVVAVDALSMLQQLFANVWARWALAVFWVLDALWAFSRGQTGKGFLALAFVAGSAWLVYIKLSGRSRLSTR